MIIDAEGYRFDFQGAQNVFKFDEQDRAKPTFHGAPMKAVDIVAVFDTRHLFVEIKEWPDPADKSIDYNEIKNRLVRKYRDSYLYRHAEGFDDKPVDYVCLLNLENPLNLKMGDDLRREIPVGKITPRWKRELVRSCAVLDVTQWNETFPKWPVKKIHSTNSR